MSEQEAKMQDLLADCVHCGFCLPACPTYVLWGEEMDSPRGRIHLMDQTLQGQQLDASTVQHFDACLGCLACVSACPSGVQYGSLISATRVQVEEEYKRPRSQRALRAAIFQLFPFPRRLRALRGRCERIRSRDCPGFCESPVCWRGSHQAWPPWSR